MAERIDVLSALLTASENADDYVGQRAAVTLREVREAVTELIEAAAEMNRLAKGPAGGVSQTAKRAVVSRMDAALARCGGVK